MTRKDIKEEELRQDLLKKLEAFIVEDFGPDCKTFAELCPVCEVYRALRVLKRSFKPYENKK